MCQIYEIAIELHSKLEELNFIDLKYEVTQRFFGKIEDFIWGHPRLIAEPVILSTNPAFKSIRTAYWNYQHEIRTYLKLRKEREIKILEKSEGNIKEEFEILEFRQEVLEHIENEPKDIIASNEIVHFNNWGKINHGLTGTQINIFNDICKFRRRDYQFGGQHLFKRSFIEEIEKLLVPETDYEIVKKILMKKGIHKEDVLTEILELAKYNINFDKEMQIYRIVKKHISIL